MNTRSVDDNWMFDDVESSDKKLILSHDKLASNDIWRKVISAKNTHPMKLEDDDWTTRAVNWLGYGNWMDEWNSDNAELPNDLARALLWDETDVVLMLYDNSDVIQTEWHVFKRNWKCFLYEDEGPILYNMANNQFAQFNPIGSFRHGANLSLKGSAL